MDTFVIEGGRRLKGRLTVSGSKNATLPIMAAALLTDQPLTLRDVPDLRDLSNMRGLLTELGCDVQQDGNLTRLHVVDETASHARYEIVRTMRASICILGPLLARRKKVRVSMPGGCAIGDRPVDLHLRGLRALGADIHLEGGDIVATAEELTGATIFLGGPAGSTVLGTANVMSAATLARGTTTIECAACEPEIVNLADTLIAMGARIEGAGTPRITIHGVDELGPAEMRIMPDRIEAGTYMIASAITNGQVTIDNCPLDALLAVLDRLEEIGVSVTRLDPAQPASRCSVMVETSRRLNPVQVTTQPHPGFPTDLQAQTMALLCLADGNSIVTERIYEQRFLHVAELSRMGASLHRQGSTVVVSGVPHLIGAPVMASDLRASASLVLAGLAARGRTVIYRVYHLDRGYQRMEERLRALGASIERVPEDQVPSDVAHAAGAAG
ncbi:MAG: UDP-N-acetylglucosamine 1-carboxyvinyltransferase [Phycisphaerales bacterium]|nr:UDP-N-acetylglucosamine 1-carboxyvinyltransferase [Phycisphaerales bacterium]